jgi:hypothetical protein
MSCLQGSGPRTLSAPLLKRLCASALVVAAASALAQTAERILELAPGDVVRYRVLSVTEPSAARDTAKRLLAHLASGEIEDAALLSTAPRRRYEVLREYRDSVGDAEFRRVYARYLAPENRLVAEIAMGERRLLIWKLAGAEHLAGQFYIAVDGRFLLDDVPSEERSKLRRILQAYRAGKL